MEDLKANAKYLGATQFGNSRAKGKRFYVIYDGTRINFGSDTNNTFVDHHNEEKRKAWRARHSKIKLKSGGFAYLNKHQPEYWSWNLLW